MRGNIMLESTHDLLQIRLRELNGQLLSIGSNGENQPGLLTKNHAIRELLVDPQFIEGLESNGEMVSIGHRIRFRESSTSKEFEYNILGSADILYNPVCQGNDCASAQSPIIAPLLGKRVGEIVPFQDQQLTILAILPLLIPEQ